MEGGLFDDGPASVERRVPLLPFSREVLRLERLKSCLAVYRMVFGQPRQEDLVADLAASGDGEGEVDMVRYRISLAPSAVEVEQQAVTAEERNTSVDRDPSGSEPDPTTSAEMIHQLVDNVGWFAPKYEPRETEEYVGLEVEGKADDFVMFRPRSYGPRLDVKVREDDPAVERLREAGGEVMPYCPYDSGPGTYPIKDPLDEFVRLRPLLRELLMAAFRTSARQR